MAINLYRLYNTNGNFSRIYAEMVDAETGEVSEGFEERMAAALATAEENREDAINEYKSVQIAMAGVKAEIENLKEKLLKLDKYGNQIMEALKASTDGNEYECQYGKLSKRKTTLTVPDANFIDWALEHDTSLLRIKPAPAPEADKAKIKEALKAGREIPAHFEENYTYKIG